MTTVGERLVTAPPTGTAPADPTATRWRSPAAVTGALIASYLVVGALLLPSFRYELNPDGVSYIAIAHHYVDGYWHEAVNGYWGPLLSWLLTPLVAAGMDGLLAVKVVNLTVGAVTLTAVWSLARRYTDQAWWRTLAVGVMVPVVLGWALILVTPDLLLVTALLWYLYVLTAPGYGQSPRYAALAGAIGGVAYLAKAYAFPFFIAHFVLTGAWRWYRAGAGSGERRLAGRALAVGVAVFAVVSGAWVAVISTSLGRLTYGTTSAYNWNLIGPTATDHPTHLPGLLPPTGPHATSAWEDPGLFQLPTWSAIDQPGHLLRVIAGNAAELGLAMLHFTPLAVLIVPLVLLGLRSRRFEPVRGLLGLTMFTAATFTAGYLIVVVEPRYVWLILVLLLLSGLTLLGGYRLRLGRAGSIVAMVVLAVSFCLPAASTLRAGYGVGATDAGTAALIRRQVPGLAGQRIASNGSYRSSLFVCYHLEARYYGITPTVDAEAARELHDDQVDYLLYWGDPAQAPGYLRDATVALNVPEQQLRVYRLH